MSKCLQRVCSLMLLLGIVACGESTAPPQPVAQTVQALPGEASGRPAPSPVQASARPEGVDPLQAMSLDEERRQAADELRVAVQALIELRKDPQSSSADLDAAQQRVNELNAHVAELKRYRPQPENLDLPEEWRSTYRVVRNGPEAELLVQVGDIDNLGFGWPAEFDPFAGESTPKHAYPWRPERDDPIGTDRIMVTSGMKDPARARRDGYAINTSRPASTPVPLAIEFDLQGVAIKGAALQLFVDDFQAPKLGSRYHVLLDGRSAPDLAATLNELEQTGPIGKLVTLRLLPEHLDVLADGRIEIMIDDPHNNVGDGFAFDFVRLLINPKSWRYVGAVRGVAVDAASNAPLEGVLVTAANVARMETGADGRFELVDVPAGLVITSGSHPDYRGASEQRDVRDGETVEVVLKLTKNDNTSAALEQQLDEDGKVDLYGIYFDLDQATLKAESQTTLEQVLELLQRRPALRVVIAGHTDNEGIEDYNLGLSERRAAAVVAWLTERGVAAARLNSEGLGESRPVADNATAAGRALNRRVEIRDASRGT